MDGDVSGDTQCFDDVHDGEKTPEKMARTDNLRVKEIFF
jgi:hypothetical protein